MPSPIRLTDAEIAHVIAAAACRRDARVAQMLAGLDEHADGAVYRVCRELQRRYFDAPLAVEADDEGPPPPSRRPRQVRVSGFPFTIRA
jgi:hypothetical protein